MGSEQVATVLRQSGEAVRLIVARPVSEPGAYKGSDAAVIPTDTLDEYLDNLFYRLMEMDALMEDAVVRPDKFSYHINPKDAWSYSQKNQLVIVRCDGRG